MAGKKEKRIEEELNRWFYLINSVVGLGAFQFGLTSLQFEKPTIPALLATMFIFILGFTMGKVEFSITYTRLRDKQNKSDREKGQLDRLKKQHLGFVATFIKAPAYFFGFLFLLAITFGVIGKNFVVGGFKMNW